MGGSVTSRWADFLPTEVSPVCERVGWAEFRPAKQDAGQAPRMAGIEVRTLRQIWGQDFDSKNGIGQDRLGRRRCFAAPGRCRHASAVYELAHNLMWLDVA